MQLVAHLRRLFELEVPGVSPSIASCAAALWTSSIIALLFFRKRFGAMPSAADKLAVVAQSKC